jgi:hypothetical protein
LKVFKRNPRYIEIPDVVDLEKLIKFGKDEDKIVCSNIKIALDKDVCLLKNFIENG